MGHGAAQEVQCNPSPGHFLLRRFRLDPPEYCLQFQQKKGRIIGLCNIIICSVAHGQDLVHISLSAGNHDHRNLGFLPQISQNLLSIGSWKENIQQHHIRAGP